MRKDQNTAQIDRAFRLYGELMNYVVDTGQIPPPEKDSNAYAIFANRLIKAIRTIDQRHQITVMPAQLKKKVRERITDIEWPTPPNHRRPKWWKGTA